LASAFQPERQYQSLSSFASPDNPQSTPLLPRFDNPDIDPRRRSPNRSPDETPEDSVASF